MCSVSPSFGRAIDYLPYFLVSFRELGEIGIGKGRGRFQLTQVLTDGGESIYDGDTQMVHNRNNALSFDEIQREAESLPNDTLTVHLLTPTRITHKGQITDKLPFHLFWRRLIGRISALAYFHCGESLELDFKGRIAQAETVQTVQSELRWHDWTRYSSRQNQKMQLGWANRQRDLCGRFGGVPAIRGVGHVPARRQKRNIWVGKV